MSWRMHTAGREENFPCQARLLFLTSIATPLQNKKSKKWDNSLPLYLKVLTSEPMSGTRRAEKRSSSSARGISLCSTQHSLNQASMWHGGAAAWVPKYMSCGLRWFKTGRMWHQWQPGSTCFWYVCFDSQLRPHGQALLTQADPIT